MEPKLKINHISFLGNSKLNILSDICAICRENVCDKCTKCANEKSPSNQCFSVMGVCNHGYHQCCIQGWTNGLSSVSQKCPMCNQKWELKKRTVYTPNTDKFKLLKLKKKIDKNEFTQDNNNSEDDNYYDVEENQYDSYGEDN